MIRAAFLVLLLVVAATFGSAKITEASDALVAVTEAQVAQSDQFLIARAAKKSKCGPVTLAYHAAACACRGLGASGPACMCKYGHNVGHGYSRGLNCRGYSTGTG